MRKQKGSFWTNRFSNRQLIVEGSASVSYFVDGWHRILISCLQPSHGGIWGRRASTPGRMAEHVDVCRYFRCFWTLSIVRCANQTLYSIHFLRCQRKGMKTIEDCCLSGNARLFSTSTLQAHAALNTKAYTNMSSHLGFDLSCFLTANGATSHFSSDRLVLMVWSCCPQGLFRMVNPKKFWEWCEQTRLKWPENRKVPSYSGGGDILSGHANESKHAAYTSPFCFKGTLLTMLRLYLRQESDILPKRRAYDDLFWVGYLAVYGLKRK